MRRVPVPRGVRARLLVTTVLAVAAALAALVVGFNVLLQERLDAQASDQARARATAALPSLTVRAGHVRISESPDSAGGTAIPVWVFDHTRAIEAPRAVDAVTVAAQRLATRSAGWSQTVAGTRLVAVPVVSHGHRVGAVVGGVSLDPSQQAAETALAGSLGLAVLVLVAVALITRMILARALQPVAAMTSTATEWSETAADRRFNLGAPHDELTQLAATLDRLLDRIAETLRREQRLTAEISHELRTPLARVAAEAELALRRRRSPEEYEQALRAIMRNADRLRRIIDALLETARTEAGGHRGVAGARAVAELAIEGCGQLAAECGVTVTIDDSGPRTELAVAVDEDVASRVLQPVLENACRYGRTRVTVSISGTAGSVEFVVTDDGRGVADTERETIFDPGRRGDGARARTDGAGLGLALSRRLARAAGGEVTVLPSRTGGVFAVRLPAAT